MSADTAERVRSWLEWLQLSDAEGADALCLSNAEVVMRQYKNPRHGKEPSAPTLQLMQVTEAIVIALAEMRRGRAHQARTELEKVLTAPLIRAVNRLAPGPEIADRGK